MGYFENLEISGAHRIEFHNPTLKQVLLAAENLDRSEYEGGGGLPTSDAWSMLVTEHKIKHAITDALFEAYQQAREAGASGEQLAAILKQLGNSATETFATGHAFPSGARAEDMMQNHLTAKDYQEIFTM